MKNVDVSKRSNIKCEHCEHYGQPKGNLYDDCFCKISGEKKNYWNRCKQFEWKRSILTLNALPALGCKGFSPCGKKIMGKSGTPEEDAEEYGNRAYNARGEFVLR